MDVLERKRWWLALDRAIHTYHVCRVEYMRYKMQNTRYETLLLPASPDVRYGARIRQESRDFGPSRLHATSFFEHQPGLPSDTP